MSQQPNTTPPPSGQQTTQQTVGGQGTPDQTKQNQTPLNVQEMQLEIANLKKLVDDNAAAQTDATTKEQAEGKATNEEIDALTKQLKEVYTGIIGGSKLYTPEELAKMEVTDLRAISHTIQRLNQQLAKEGKNLPSSTTLGLPDNLQGNPPATSSKEFKEPFDYNPKDGTWRT